MLTVCGLMGIVLTLIELVIYTIFRQAQKPLFYCLLASVLCFAAGFYLTLHIEPVEDDFFWFFPTFIIPIVLLLLTFHYGIEAYHYRIPGSMLKGLDREERRVVIKCEQEKILESKRSDKEQSRKRKLELQEKILETKQNDKEQSQKQKLEQQNDKEQSRKQKHEQRERNRAARKKEKLKKKELKEDAKYYKRYMRDLATTIVRTSIVGSDSKANASSAVGRAIVGDFIAGGVGSIIGASTAKKDGMTKFLVEYANGRKTVETVKDNSFRFTELVSYLDK